MQCNSRKLTTATLLSFLGIIKNYPACKPAAYKRFQQPQLGSRVTKVDLETGKIPQETHFDFLQKIRAIKKQTQMIQ